MGITKVQPWSTILDGYEEQIKLQDYEPVFIMMDLKTGTPVMDVVTDGVEFLFLADTEEELTSTIDRFIPSALQSDDVHLFETNWAFIRTKYRALNYNGRRITMDGTSDDHTLVCSTNEFSSTLIPTLTHWFTAVYRVDDKKKFGVLSTNHEGKQFAIATDSTAQLLCLLTKSGHDDIAVETMASPSVTIASLNLTKLSGACDGIAYRGNYYLFSDIYAEAKRCAEKFQPDNEAMKALLEVMQSLDDRRSTEEDGE